MATENKLMDEQELTEEEIAAMEIRREKTKKGIFTGVIIGAVVGIAAWVSRFVRRNSDVIDADYYEEEVEEEETQEQK